MWKNHLRYDAVDLPRHVKMNVRRSHGPENSRISGGLDGFEAITSFRVRDLDGEALKIRIRRNRARVAWMHVTPFRIGLPYLDFRAAYGFALQIHDAAHQMDHLAFRVSGFTGDRSQIGVLVEGLHL